MKVNVAEKIEDAQAGIATEAERRAARNKARRDRRAAAKAQAPIAIEVNTPAIVKAVEEELKLVTNPRPAGLKPVEQQIAEIDRQVELVAAVKAHALKNYNRSGWDIVVETMTDADIIALFGKARTEAGAIKVVLDHVLPIHRLRQDIIAAGE